MTDTNIYIRVLGTAAMDILKPPASDFFNTYNSEREITLFVGYSGFDVPIGF